MLHAAVRRLVPDRPAATSVARLTATATFAYLLALLVPAGTDRPVLAPLTALLVLQASLYQTIRSGIRKVASVTAGVLVAVVVAGFSGFSWWQLGLVIAAALVIGQVLRLGDDLLEVPISAMLIFAAAGSHAAADGRVADTLVGTAAGLAGGLVFGKPHVQSAREAVGTVAGQLGDLLGQMAADLTAPGGCAAAGDGPPGRVADGPPAWVAGGQPAGAGDGRPAAGPSRDCVAGWLTRARALRDEIERVDDTLRQAADSVRLNPRSRLGQGRRTPGTPPADSLLVTEVTLRGGLEALELATVTVRGLARSVLDSTGSDSDSSPVRDEQTRARLADVLSQLAGAIRTYGRLVQLFPAERESLGSQLAEQLAAAHQAQDELADLLRPRLSADGAGSSEWPLRGEILTHVDRLRTGLRPDTVPGAELTARTPGARRRGAARTRQPATRPRLPAAPTRLPAVPTRLLATRNRRNEARAQRRERDQDRPQQRDRRRPRAQAWRRAGRTACQAVPYSVRERISAQRAR